jgi:hypothetical protein
MFNRTMGMKIVVKIVEIGGLLNTELTNSRLKIISGIFFPWFQ